MSKFSMADLLNSQSKPEAPKTGRKDEIVKIPIDKIKQSPKNKYGIRDIEDLAATIEMVGLLHNLVVKEGAELGTYELVSGGRRLEALKLLVQRGKTEYAEAACKIEGTDDPAISELQLLFANSTARELTDYEKTYQAKRIKELLLQLKQQGYKFKGRMREIVADVLKVSPAQMGRMESISKNLSPDFKEEFKDGKINASAAYELSRLPEQQQVQELQQFKASGSVEVKDVQQHRKRGRPRKSEVAQREQAAPAEQKPAQRPEPVIPEQGQREPGGGKAAVVIGRLKATAEYFKDGSGSAPLDVHAVCLEAADLIADLEGRLKEE